MAPPRTLNGYDPAFAERARADFPALEQSARPRGGAEPAFFDGPGGTQVPRSVVDAVSRYLVRCNANTHGQFATSAESDAVIDRARAAMADFLGAGDPDEIVFGANMTTLTFHLSRSLGRTWGPGDEVIVTELDHQANVAPWRRMAEDAGMTVRMVPLDRETLQLDYAAFESMLGARTRLVAVGAASNALGTVNDVRRVTDAARRAGALSFVDAVAYAPHHRVSVEEMGCDFLACSAYKFFGPHVGVLWGRRELLDRYTPYKVPPADDRSPMRWETGTLNHEGIAGTLAAVEWIAALAGEAGAGSRRERLERAFRLVQAHESALFAELEAGLRATPGVTFYGVAGGEPRTPTAAFTIRGVSAEAAARALGEQGIFVWDGHFYASTVVDALDLDDRGGLIRAGIAPYIDRSDVHRLLEGVRALAGQS